MGPDPSLKPLSWAPRILGPVFGRYLLREILVPYLVGVLLFVALLTFDLLSSLSGALLSRGAGLEEVGRLVLYRLPWTLSLALPLGLVFGILVGISGLIRRSELKAAYAAGIPPRALLGPLLLLALGVTLLNLLNLAAWRPRALEAYDRLLAHTLYGGEVGGPLRRVLYAPPGLGVYYAEEVWPEGEGNRLRGVRVVDEGGRVYSAGEGLWDGRGWRIQGYRLEGTEVTPFEGYLPFPVRFRPKESWGSNDPFDTSTLGELLARARVEPEARFALYRRLADAIGAFFLALVAAGLGLGLREAAWAFLGVILLIFGYYVLWTLVGQLARYGLPPGMAFLPNLAYGLLGAWLLWRLR